MCGFFFSKSLHSAREYTFDVRYTSREVHDRARRNLYHAATEASVRSMPTMPGESGMPSGQGQLTIVSLPGQIRPAVDTSSSSLNRTTSRTSHTDESMASMEVSYYNFSKNFFILLFFLSEKKTELK